MTEFSPLLLVRVALLFAVMGWLIILVLFVALLASVIAELQFRLALYEEVEAGIPLQSRRSWQIRLEPKGATERALLLQHRRLFPDSPLRRKFYIARVFTAVSVVGLFVVAWCFFGSTSQG